MYNYRKIPASTAIFQKLYNRNTIILDNFSDFLDLETEVKKSSSKKKIKGKSNKADSYKKYIIRILLIINETLTQPINLDDSQFYLKLYEIRETKEFKNYNHNENRFPNASLESFVRFWDTSLKHIDNYLESSVDFIDTSLIQINPLLPKQKNEAYKLITFQQKRSNKERSRAFYSANFTCEAKCSNELFINASNNLPYLEAHHLIPLSYQKDFEYSIDVSANIISLCPSCHRKIHHGTDSSRKELVQYFYQRRLDNLKKTNIEVSESELLDYYRIVSL